MLEFEHQFESGGVDIEMVRATDQGIRAQAPNGQAGRTELSHGDAGGDARLSRLLRLWWHDERPAWTERGWWDAPLRDHVRSLLWLPAGPLLAARLASLERSATCPGPHLTEGLPGEPAPGQAPGWPCACMVIVAAAWEACSAWAAAGSATALVDAMGPAPVVVDVSASGQRITDPAREELAHALRLSPNSMGNRISAARDLLAHPRLVALVESAAISAWAARLVVLELADLTSEQSSLVVQEVCDRIGERRAAGRPAWTSAEVGRRARMARCRICPESDRATRERAFLRRRVQVFPDKNGMAVVVADLDETDAHRVHRRLSAIARGLKGDTEQRTRDQIRADVFVDLLLGAPASRGVREARGDSAPPPGDPAIPAAGRPEIQVVVSLETLLALSRNPAVIPGLGPIAPERARELAADGQWRAWVTDSTGAVVASGSAGYVPSAGLARQVRAREPFCRMPGCRHPAERCDLDHTVAYPGGPTTAANLGPLCRRHHNLKTHLGWTLEPVEHPSSQDRSGRSTSTSTSTATSKSQSQPPAWRWRTPAGFTITDHPTSPLE